MLMLIRKYSNVTNWDKQLIFWTYNSNNKCSSLIIQTLDAEMTVRDATKITNFRLRRFRSGSPLSLLIVFHDFRVVKTVVVFHGAIYLNRTNYSSQHTLLRQKKLRSMNNLRHLGHYKPSACAELIPVSIALFAVCHNLNRFNV